MTNLDRDIIMAEKLGYGIHYGRYKADHPVTADTPVKVETPPADAVCQQCGGPIYRPRHNQKYCCARCQSMAGMQRYRQKQKVLRDADGLQRNEKET